MSKTIINMRLLAASAAFASAEQNRYYLVGVLLEIGPSGVYYVATDGHRMIVSHKAADDAQCHDWRGPSQIIVPYDDCKRLKIKKSSADADLSVNDDGTCTFAHPDLTWSFKPVDGTYPDWRRILPSDDKGKAQAHWNFAYAQSFQEFATKMDFGIAQIIQRDGNSAMPVVFSHVDCRSFGVLMPMRAGETSFAIPAWVNPDRAPALRAAE